MDILFTEIADSLGLKCTDSCYRHVKGSFMDFGDIVMKKGFFFYSSQTEQLLFLISIIAIHFLLMIY